VRKLLFGAGAVLLAQTWQPGPQVGTFFSAIDDSDQPYGLYVPKEYSTARRWPLVVSLHGAGSNHRLNLRRVFGKGNRPGEPDSQASRYFPPLADIDMIVASPLARGTMGYQGIAEQDVLDVLADVKNRFAIDDDRVYLTGLSMGGGGALWIGLTRPDLWAAIAPVCPAPPEEAAELAGNAINVPMKLFQGAIDPVVPAAGTREWHQRLTAAGVQAEYVEYPGIRHNSWDLAYKDAAIFDWFRGFRRERMPRRVRFSTRSYRHGSAYWIRLDGITPGTLATIDARREGTRVLVDTEGVEGFTLALKDRLATVAINGTEVRLKPGAALSFSRTPKGWAVVAVKTPAGKRAGLEGPVFDALAAPHVYVHGPDTRELATAAADWSTTRSKLLLNFRVIEDRAFSETDGNIVLFGTRETNSVLAKYSAALPLHLNPGAADYGLVYTYPVGNRMVVVNSGLPYWTRIDQAKVPGFGFLPLRYRLLRSFGDFVLFKGGIDNIVAEGRFDNQWKLPEGMAERFRATGAVEVRQQ
jgi:predicted esterase